MRHEYDEEASAAELRDVVYPVAGSTAPVARWVDAMRRLNAIDDPLARKLLGIHRDCGSGSGVCDGSDYPDAPSWSDWGCDTTRVIADHFGVEYPRAPDLGAGDINQRTTGKGTQRW